MVGNFCHNKMMDNLLVDFLYQISIVLQVIIFLY